MYRWHCFGYALNFSTYLSIYCYTRVCMCVWDCYIHLTFVVVVVVTFSNTLLSLEQFIPIFFSLEEHIKLLWHSQTDFDANSHDSSTIIYIVRQSNFPKYTTHSKWRLRIVCRLSLPRRNHRLYKIHWIVDVKTTWNVSYQIIKIQKA